MSAIDDNSLRAALDEVLQSYLGEPPDIVMVQRRPCAYRTSFPLEEIDVELADGTRLAMMLKDLGHGSLTPDAARAKPRFLHDPLREISTYREVLSGAALGTPEYYGESTDPRSERHWLFIERVDGDVLWQVGEVETWAAAARWLARLHERFAGAAAQWPFLLRYDGALWRVWIDRAAGFARDGDAGRWGAGGAERILRLADSYGDVADRLAALPPTFIHGEFYPSNVLVGPGPDPGARRIAPIDWELAACGPGLLDLAALTTGWPAEDSAAIEVAYLERHEPETRGQPLDEALAACRLHLAVQWLAWEPSWSPPAEHRRDWLAEAELQARALGLGD
jgi:aminoglycoside phosphotransferase (APT) family kinase protein